MILNRQRSVFGRSLRSPHTCLPCIPIRHKQTSAYKAFLEEAKKKKDKEENERKYQKKKSTKAFKFTSSAFIFVATLGVGYSQGRLQVLNQPPKSLFPETSTAPVDDIRSPYYANEGEFEKACKLIERVVGPNGFTDSDAEINGHADSYYSCMHPEPDQKPDLVVYVRSTAQVSKIMDICHRFNVPVVPYCGGTSIEGQYISTRGGIVLDFSKMADIVKFNEEDRTLTVQAGATWQDLEEFLKPSGLLFGPDPGPGAQIGGMVATSCSGTNAYRYGTMKENVVSLKVVLSDGTVVDTGSSNSGYDLTRLIVGSEGTLGLVTEATLRLAPRPKAETVALVSFDNVFNAVQAAQDIISRGIPLNAIELLNAKSVFYVNQSGLLHKKLEEKPTLLMKIGGASQSLLDETVKITRKITKTHNETAFKFASNEEEMDQLWMARKVLYWSNLEYAKKAAGPDVNAWTTDVAVPISALPKMVDQFEKELDKSGIIGSIIGHVGDGNFHALLMYTQDQKEAATNLVSRMVDQSLKLEGTSTGEHGIGYHKREFLIEEVGQTSVDTMRKLKMVLDSKRILNPDKVIVVDRSEPQPDRSE
ncbi:unnamed protein product [Kuraishia capsulata CBS 1993]|uniref:D-lactate dehydrogenase (cytochrome) n=1 Tax=Kuraishia capsulata CBS 1993 TaxID=1382522 RepID=W6MXD7_9ASCO|nr:uncharacterized protein KUCA_T00004694001 [Kuraishia capsulata CBS 1993]CDK28710.1 unnamed protein product [Kuraishia capsulata CBS 1993]